MLQTARTLLYRLVVFLPVVALLLAAPALAVAQDATPASAPVIDGRFDIGGRSLYLRCSGSGSPTVILEGFPIAQDWAQVEAGSGSVTRTCYYDPAGFGLSDPPPAGWLFARSLGEDLWALLAAAGVDGPYVFVGAVGGADALLYYHRRYPNDVAGLVLVSPRGLDPATHERFTALLPEVDRAAEMAGFNQGGAQTVAEFATLPPGPTVPAIVVRGSLPEDQPRGWPVEEIDTVLREAQEQVARDLDARLVVAEGVKGNSFWTDRPDVIVQAISDVVAAVRDPGSWQSTAATPSA